MVELLQEEPNILDSRYRVMDSGSNEFTSFTRTSSAGSSQRRRSLSLRRTVSSRIEDDIERESVSESGDIGDRALSCNRLSESSSIRFSLDGLSQNGVVFPVQDHNLLQPQVQGEDVSPLSTDAIVCSKEENQEKVKKLVLPPWFEYISCLVYLAAFGILGVLSRYLLQKLFGPGIAGVTSDHTALYLDLPSNMLGSFLMGWLGVVFKPDIANVSDHLAIGLTTGYLGSLTTFSGWNQKMLDLSVGGNWVDAIVGFLLGLFLAAYSIKFGIGTATSFRLVLAKMNKNRTGINWKVDSCTRHMAAMAVLMVMLALLWSVSGALLSDQFKSGNSEAELWLACLVAAPGVWIRWFLARINGRGLGKAGYLKWMPFGTLIANVSAACVMAALATLKKAVQSKTCNMVSTGIQLGFLGCLSTVSTFIAEYNSMEERNKHWMAYAYALTTILVSFSFGILTYGVPVWVEGYR